MSELRDLVAKADEILMDIEFRLSDATKELSPSDADLREAVSTMCEAITDWQLAEGYVR